MIAHGKPVQKAGRNRTLKLSEQEISILNKKLFIPKAGKKALQQADLINKTICADLSAIIGRLPESFADLVFADPPYNLSKNFHGLQFNPKNPAAYIDYLETWLPAISRTLKPGGSMYVCCDWKSSPLIYQVLSQHLTIMNRITWQREKGRGASKNWKNGMEDIWFAVKNPDSYYFNSEAVKVRRKVLAPYRVDGNPKDWVETSEGNYRLTFPSNFWDDLTVPYWSMSENTDHPTQKPEKLLAKIILASCPEGGLVFDPFLGSGTTSVTAKKLKRLYSGVEINPLYCCLCEKRLELAEKDKTIQGLSDGVFWERNSKPLPKRK